MSIRLAIAVVLLAFLSASASAQVGIRIGGGGIGLGLVGPPLLSGREPSHKAERRRAPQRAERTRRKRSDDDDVKQAKKAPVVEESKVAKGENENSSISGKAADTPATSTVAGSTSGTDAGAVASNENSTITGAGSSAVVSEVANHPTASDTEGTGTTAATCKRYFPTVGKTITVPCN